MKKAQRKKQPTYAPANPKQSRKFKEAAKQRGVDQDSKAFGEAYRNLTGRSRKEK